MQSQRKEGKIKTSFSFVVNISKYVLKDGIKSSIHPTCTTTKHKRVKKIEFFGICSSLSFLFWFIALIVIQKAYVVHTHTQFNKIGTQSYANDCSS